MRKAEVGKILRKKYIACRDEAIKIVQGLPLDSRQSGEDSGLEDVWEEFKIQVQREESGAFDLYVETIEGLCEDLVKRLPDHELELLWLDADAYFDHDDEKGPPGRDEMTDGIARELYQLVLNRAADEDLKFDPDEARQAEAFQDDLMLSSEPRHEPNT